MRILIAEDDTIIADGLSRSLRQGGYAVDWAAKWRGGRRRIADGVL